MAIANPACPYKLEVRVLGWTQDGQRLEPHDPYFLRVVKSGILEDVPADIYNSAVYPISEFLHVDGITAWQAQMEGLVAIKEAERIASYRDKGYTFAVASPWQEKLGL